MRVLIPCALLMLLSNVHAQRVLLVDGTGGSGQYRKIGAAIAAFRNGDLILVRKGVYVENLIVDGKYVNIMGVEANPGDVIVRSASSSTATLTIKNHPAGRVSRFSRFRIERNINSASIESRTTKGDLVFDLIDTDSSCDFRDHQGVLALSGCNLRSRSSTLTATNVRNVFCHDCRFLTSAVNSYLVVWPNTTIWNCRAHLSHCTMNGSQGGKYLFVTYPGGPALTLISSTVRVSGLASDGIHGGNGITSGSRTSPGGVGISLLVSSRLTISGVTVAGGLGAFFGTIIRAQPFQQDRTSMRTTAVPAMPVLATRSVLPLSKPYSRGVATGIDVHASPRALSMTWIAVDFSPFATPWGDSVIVLSKPALVQQLTHDAAGKAGFVLDLRTLPATFVGIHYAVQTLALDTSNRLSLSGPRLGVVGF